MTEREIRQRLWRILSLETGICQDKIYDNSKLGFDLRIGSILGGGEFLDLLDEIERNFQLTIDRSDLPILERAGDLTVGEIVEYLKGRVTWY